MIPIVMLALLTSTVGADRDAVPEASVGMPLRLRDVILPGPQLEARPWTDRRQDLVVRILDVYRHGDAFRYDLECVGYEPGQYDLRNHLQPKGNGASAELPPIPIRIVTLLPKGQIEPHALSPRPTPRWSRYRVLLVALAVLWALGLLALLVRWRKRQLRESEARPAPSVVDRLQPLVARAQRGELSIAEQAEIERLLLAHWRESLALDEEHPALALAALREHAAAGALLRQLEAWLHDPQAEREIDLSALLEPYRQVARAAAGRSVGAGAAAP